MIPILLKILKTGGVSEPTPAPREEWRTRADAIGARLANSREWPQWSPSSEFAKIRQQSQGARTGG